MKIWTCYFDYAKYLSEERYCVVSIARFSPRWFRGYKCRGLAPSASLLKFYRDSLASAEYESRVYSQFGSEVNVSKVLWADYESRYRAEMGDAVRIHSCFEQIARIAKGRDIVLCCHEAPNMPCHRFILADMVREIWHYNIFELRK